MMMTKMTNKHIPNFADFLIESKKDDSNTSNYTAPEYVVQPPVGDTGWEIVSKAFNDQKPYFKPGIKSGNKELDEHDYE
jgi:hypothetical protein